MPYRDHTPTYRLHKATGQAVVTIDGRDHYLGDHGSAASREAFDRLIAQWFANGRTLPAPVEVLSVGVLALRYLDHADVYYRKPDGSPTSEATAIRQALRVLNRLFAHTPAADFGPLKLKAVRQGMLDAGWARTTINRQISRIRQMFKWGAANELVSGSLCHGLAALDGLRRGRSAAKETDPVKPVPAAHIEAVMPHVSAQVAGMIELQRLTGMRPGEACMMRGCDLVMLGKVWIYRPAEHKTLHHGHIREIFLGPRASAVVERFLKADLQAHLFSPADAEAARNLVRRSVRKTPMTPSQAARQPQSRRKRPPRTFYTVDSYRRAIARGAVIAGVPSWHPHQLRHNAATELRARYGIEAARVILGHRSAAVTEVYAEQDRGAAIRIMGEAG